MADGEVLRSAGTAHGTGKRLLFPVTPEAGETLLGYVVRCVGKNHLGTPVQFMQNAGVNLAIRGDMLARLQTQLPDVASLLGRTRGELGALWGSEPSPDQRRRLGGVLLRPELVNQTRMRVPPSIKTEQADNALWMIKHLDFCPQTWERLVDECPNRWCGKALTWPRAQSLDRCRHCGTSVGRWPSQKVAKEHRDVLAWVVDFFNDCSQVRGAAMRRITPVLDVNTETEVYELLVAFKHVMKLVRTERSEEGSRVDEAPAHIDLAAAARLMLDYPRSIWDELQNRTFDERRLLLSMMNRVGRDTTVVSVRQAIRKITHRDIPERTHPGARHAPTGTITAGDAAKELRVPPGDITRLVEAEVLRPLRSSGRRRKHHRFDAAKIEEIRRSLETRMSWRRFSRTTRLPTVAIEQLVALGLLTPFSHPAAEVLYGDRHLEEDAAASFIRRLEALPLAHAGAGMTLQQAMAGVGGREKPWAPVLLAGLNKQLPGGLARLDPMWSLADLVISPVTARSLIMGGPGAVPMFSFDPAQYGRRTRAWMGPGEVQDYLNCSSVDKAWLLERGHIATFSQDDGRLYDRELIQRFGHTWMTTKEAATRLGISPRHLWRVLENYDFKYELGHGFHLREELEPVIKIEAASRWSSLLYGEVSNE